MKRLSSSATVKVSIYLPAEALAEMFAEAERLDRPFSWIVREAVRIAMPKVRAVPAPPGGET